MSLWRKLAFDLARDMHIPSEPNNRNTSAVKVAYQFQGHVWFMLWNAESKTIVESCPLVLRTTFILEESDVLKKNWSKHTHTQTHKHPCRHSHNTHTTCQQTLIFTQQKSLRQWQNCVTVFSVDWLQEQQEVLKVKYLLQSWETSKHSTEKDLYFLHNNHSVSGAPTLLFHD